jgi:hypothetical protein
MELIPFLWIIAPSLAAFAGGSAYGVLGMNPARYKEARILFSIAGLSVAAMALLFGLTVPISPIGRLIGTFVIGGIAAIIIVEATRWVAKIEQGAPVADVTMRLVYPQRPALLLENISDVVASQIKWTVALMNIDGADAGKPAQIPIGVFDFIRGREQGGPQNLFDPPNIVKTPANGQQLFGWVQVTCPACAKIRYWWTYIKFGSHGWYVEVSKERHEEINRKLREGNPYSDQDVDRVLSIVPANERVAIKDP